MCFTVAVNIIREEMERRYGVRFIDPSWFKAGYLFSAFRLPVLPVITSDHPDLIQPVRWGLIPSRIKSRQEAEETRYMTFNARAETIFEKPTFRLSAETRRCLIPVSGFYEWHKAHSKKIPFYIYRKDSPVFTLAGLYDHWVDRETGEIEPTFCVITTKADEIMEKIHNTQKRMPLMLTRDDEKQWLDNAASKEEIMNIIQTIKTPDLAYHAVSRNILSPKTDIYDPVLIRPVEYGIDPLNDDLFKPRNQ